MQIRFELRNRCFERLDPLQVLVDLAIAALQLQLEKLELIVRHADLDVETVQLAEKRVLLRVQTFELGLERSELLVQELELGFFVLETVDVALRRRDSGDRQRKCREKQEVGAPRRQDLT